MGGQPPAPRRHLRLRRRLPARQPLGCGHLRDARARGKDHPHAVRILARAWIYVIWRCWHDGTAYDPAKHDALQRILAGQHAAQAAGPAPQENQ